MLVDAAIGHHGIMAPRPLVPWMLDRGSGSAEQVREHDHAHVRQRRALCVSCNSGLERPILG